MKQLKIINNRLLAKFLRHGLRVAAFSFLLGPVGGSLVCAQRSAIHSSHISTLQVVAGEDWLSMPVVELGGSPIRVSFDDMTHEYHRYTYKLEHCDAGWNLSSGLFSSDFVSGFNGELTIEDSEESLNTNRIYTHYRLAIPNENCRISMSGNYKLTVYDEDGGNGPVLTACFMVVEPKMKVSADYSSNTDVDVNKGHQQVSFRVEFGDVRVTDPARQVKTVVLQNGRWDNAVFDAKPDYISADGLSWAHNRKLIFDAGNVYRKFEMLDLNHTTMGLDEVKWDGRDFHAFVFPDTPRPSYVHGVAPQGAFYIRNSDNQENDFTSDYAWVHFRLQAPKQMGEVYLNGDWTYDSFLPQYKMWYNEEQGEYEGTVLLKQGYYSYQYLLLREDGAAQPVSSEGSFYQTSNKYQVLVYYRGPSDRADRLLGFVEVKKGGNDA